MGKDKISTCIKNWIDIQQQRLSEAKMYRVRVETDGTAYYDRVQITKNFMSIDPDDAEINGSYITQRRLNGFNDVNNKAIELKQINQKPSIKLYFKSQRERNLAIAKLRILISEETTSESSGSSVIPSPEPCCSTQQGTSPTS